VGSSDSLVVILASGIGRLLEKSLGTEDLHVHVGHDSVASNR